MRAERGLEQALCVWMNSTFAIAWLRTLFTTLEDKFGHIYGWHMRILKIPDLTKTDFIKNLGKVFNAYAQTIWTPLPHQFEEARKGMDSIRLKYDLDVLRALSKASRVKFDEDGARIGLKALYSEISQLL